MTPAPPSAARPRVAEARLPAPGVVLPLAERLGDALLEQGVVSEEQLKEALARHRRIGEPLGAVLLAEGLLSRRELYVALAQVWGADLTFVDPAGVDPQLARLFPSAMLAREVWVPLSVERTSSGEPQVVVATAGRPSAHIAQVVFERTGIEKVRQVVTTDWDVQRVLRTVWREDLVHEAVRSLAERRPEESASTVFVWWQVASGLTLAIGTVVGAVLWFSTTMLVLVATANVAVALAVVAKALISTVGTAYETVEQVTDSEVAALTDAELPHYSILIPVYKEAGIVGLLMRNLAALDYPREKLEILLLLEEDDPDTLEAALAAAPPDLVRILVVPHSMPKTKPRACNVGLAFARGEFVVIFDAEDRPEPDQLKKALLAFRKGGEELVCVQAALNYYNADENLLTRMFTLEYSSWFDYTLAGLDKLRLPIPLGGTSNHFRTDMLRELGGWDPFNVTEDADLGIRASARGYRVAVVNSTTFEEANMALGNWLRQRSRWIKGYMQTVLVHTRHPLRLVRTVGARQAAGFGLLIGGTPVMFLLTPWLYGLFIAELIWPGGLLPVLPLWLVLVSTANLLLGNGLIVYLALLAGFKRRNYRLVGFALLAPLYWLLHSLAAYKAAWQLLTKPFYWEKTTHGLTSHTQPYPSADAGTTRPAGVDATDPRVLLEREPTSAGTDPAAGHHVETRPGEAALPAGARATILLEPVGNGRSEVSRPATTGGSVDPAAPSPRVAAERLLVRPPTHLDLRRLSVVCAVATAVSAASTVAIAGTVVGALYAACFTVMAAFALAYCLRAVTVAGFAAGSGAAGLAVLEPTWLLPVLGWAVLVAVVCGLAPGWAHIEAWQAHRYAAAGTVAPAGDEKHWIVGQESSRRRGAARLVQHWRTDRAWATFLVLAYLPLVTAGSNWFMWWMANR